MTFRVLGALAVGAAITFVQEPQFRSRTDVVALVVSVRNGGQAVLGLTSSDFEVKEDGIEQRVTTVSRNTLPLDVTCEFDSSGSVADDQARQMQSVIARVIATLHSDDQIRAFRFGGETSEVMAFRPVAKAGLGDGVVLGNPAASSFGGTALFDAIALGLIAQPATTRRSLLIALTDGWENASLIASADLSDVARRTDSQADILVSLPSNRFIPVAQASRQEPWKTLAAVAATTGGQFLTMDAHDDVSTALISAIGKYRDSYIVSYSLPGKLSARWREVSVRVRGHSTYEVRTRRGYVY